MNISVEELKALKRVVNLTFDARKKFGGPITEKEANLVDALYHRLKKGNGELTFGQLQNEQAAWADHNFDNQTSDQYFKGLVEELGELAHADLKQSQGIRGTTEEHEAEAQDAIGDLLIYLAGYTTQRGWSLQDIIEEVWPQVKTRDWRRWPNSGFPERTCLECHGNGHLSPDELGFGPGDYEPEDLQCRYCIGKGWRKIEKSNAPDFDEWREKKRAGEET